MRAPPTNIKRPSLSRRNVKLLHQPLWKGIHWRRVRKDVAGALAQPHHRPPLDLLNETRSAPLQPVGFPAPWTRDRHHPKTWLPLTQGLHSNAQELTRTIQPPLSPCMPPLLLCSSRIAASFALRCQLPAFDRGSSPLTANRLPNGSSSIISPLIAHEPQLTVVAIVALFAHLPRTTSTMSMKMAAHTPMSRTICPASTSPTTTLWSRIAYPCNTRSLSGHSKES